MVRHLFFLLAADDAFEKSNFARFMWARHLSAESARGKQGAALAKWKVINQGKDAFNVVAGDFEIEYFTVVQTFGCWMLHG